MAFGGTILPLQLVHENDLAKLLYQLVMEPHGGTFNVAGEGVVFYSELARISRRRLVSLPAAVAYPLTQMAWNLGVQKDSPSVGLNFCSLRHDPEHGPG